MFHTTCLICQSPQLKKMEGYQKFHLVKCQSCAFIFSQKKPTEKELVEHYNGYGRNDYLSPITIKRYEELLDKMEVYRKTNRILDVGCGIGYFLEVAKERGWEVYGTEYTDLAITTCEDKGITMNQGKLNSANYDPESFDIITSFEVIEHINNPLEDLKEFHSLARKGGLVYVTTPNFNSLLRYRLKANYDVICYPEHLSYYTPKTLNKVFRTSNFKVLKLETTGISLTRLRRGQGKSNQAVISSESTDEKIRIGIESKKHLQVAKVIVNKTLTLFGVGDSLKGWYVKKI